MCVAHVAGHYLFDEKEFVLLEFLFNDQVVFCALDGGSMFCSLAFSLTSSFSFHVSSISLKESLMSLCVMNAMIFVLTEELCVCR